MKKLLSLLVTVATTVTAFAHEGHGHTDGYTIKHYLTEPEHVIPIVIATAMAIVLVAHFRKSMEKK
jgi:hydrogenase/urease accessory protein HupE